MATLYLSFIYPSESEFKTIFSSRRDSCQFGRESQTEKLRRKPRSLPDLYLSLDDFPVLGEFPVLKRVSRLPNKHDMGNIGRLSNGR